MVPVESDVPHARRWHEAKNSLYHSKAGAEDWDERQLLSADVPPRSLLEGSVHLSWLETQLASGLVGHEHCDLIDELLEALGLRLLIAKDRQLVLNEGMPDNNQRRELLNALDHSSPRIPASALWTFTGS